MVFPNEFNIIIAPTTITTITKTTPNNMPREVFTRLPRIYFFSPEPGGGAAFQQPGSP